jgi:flagellar biosynthesis chaperone FliJ
LFARAVYSLTRVLACRALKRQQDNRHKQLDRFEASLKSATEAQRQWRQRVQQKTLELENAKVRRRAFRAATLWGVFTS